MANFSIYSDKTQGPITKDLLNQVSTTPTTESSTSELERTPFLELAYFMDTENPVTIRQKGP
jgi:hypothetical protein